MVAGQAAGKVIGDALGKAIVSWAVGEALDTVWENFFDPNKGKPKGATDFDTGQTNITNTTINVFNTGNPTLSPSPSVVYVPVGTGAKPRVNIDIKNPPVVPGRRLPREADGQGDTKTPKKKSISIKQRLTERPYGGLLCHPITTDKPTYYELGIFESLSEQLKIIGKQSLDNFALWLAIESGVELEDEDKAQLKALGGTVPPWDATALICSSSPAGFGGNIGYSFGLAPLNLLAQAYRISRQNAFQKVTGYVPKEHSIERVGQEIRTNFSPFSQNLVAGGLAGIRSAVGAGEYPVKVPVSLLIEDEDIINFDSEELDDKAYRKVASLPELILWLTEVLDETIGKFPLTLEIGESDLLDLKPEYERWKRNPPKPNSRLPWYLQNDKLVSFSSIGGRLVKTVKVPNLAEALAELLGNNMAEGQRNTLTQEFLTRILIETGSVKNMGSITSAWVEAIADYLGFAANDKEQEVPYSFNPVADSKNTDGSLKDFLTPTKVKVGLPEYSDKQTMEGYMGILKEAHAIIKTANTEGIGKNDRQMFARIKALAELLNGTEKKDPDDPRDEFDKFLDEVEYGFSQTPGASDPTKVYGREFKERPRVRRLTQKNDAGGSSNGGDQSPTN